MTKKSILGVSGPKIKPTAARRLNFKIRRIRQNYIVKLEEEFRKHRILERLATLEEKLMRKADENFSKHAKETLEKLDSHITALMTHAEKQCRMLYKNDYDFSPKVKYSLEKGRALRVLGKEDNIANVKQTAKRCGITHPLSYTRQGLWTTYSGCKKKCAEMLADLPWLQKQFLSARLHDALENGREEEANEIQAIMRGENQRRNWRSIDREMGKIRTPAPTMVETVDEDGKVT